MELRVLKYYLAVCKEKNIINAAKSLHLTQPTLSRQLQDLEKELGKKLFVRSSKYITLTEEGVILRKRAEEILDLTNKTENEVKDVGENITGTIYIGAAETYIMHYVARAMKTLKSKYYDVDFNIFSGDMSDVTDKIDSGLIDFALVLHPDTLSKFNYIKLPFYDEFGILTYKKSNISKLKIIRVNDLYNEPLIVSDQVIDSSAGIEKLLGRKKERLNIVATYNLINNARILVEEKIGHALCLDKLVKIESGSNLLFKKITPAIKVDAYVIWKKNQNMTKLQMSFLEEIKKLEKKGANE